MSEIVSTGDFVWTSGDPPPNDHTLNAYLARVIGVELKQVGKNVEEWWVYGCGDLVYGSPVKWDPLHNANQMELVENSAQHVHKIRYEWDGECWHVQLDYGMYYKHNHDKKRAFALAIWEMMKCDNIQKTELPVS